MSIEQCAADAHVHELRSIVCEFPLTYSEVAAAWVLSGYDTDLTRAILEYVMVYGGPPSMDAIKAIVQDV